MRQDGPAIQFGTTSHLTCRVQQKGGVHWMPDVAVDAASNQLVVVAQLQGDGPIGVKIRM